MYVIDQCVSSSHVCCPAAQAGNKPATSSSAAEAKTEPTSQSAEPAKGSDTAAGTVAKQDVRSAAVSYTHLTLPTILRV